MEVIGREDHIMSMQRDWFIFVKLTDNSELLLNNSCTRADLFWLEHTINNKNTFEVFSIVQLSAIALKKSCNSWTVCICLHAFVRALKCQNVTSSNAMTDVILQW